jgi:lysozyme family protein
MSGLQGYEGAGSREQGKILPCLFNGMFFYLEVPYISTL